jgi:DMSO/TMAO reductase YedYZ molybdopterin-dependent catalytic subunit
MTHETRRSAIARMASATAGLLGSGYLDGLAAQQPCADGAAAGTLVATLPLSRPDGVIQPYGVKFGGAGLDARQITDLSRLAPDRLITPSEAVFVRTERPAAAARRSRPWRIATGGLAAREGSLTIDELTRGSRPMGTHLLECAGNNNPANFGLMSVAAWDGVLLADIVSRLQPTARATAVLVSGIDNEAGRSAVSVAGAGWILPLAALDRLGAFVALRMNGEPLPPDHGLPVRLVVPGWYGCSWIKWVDGIRVVGAEEPATSQMKEFAGRTHQAARHDLARDYGPADIQAAAMPIRVEQRRTAAGVHYRIVGIAWGGDRPADRLEIRFGPGDSWEPVAICPPRPAARIWMLWEHRWSPAAAGVYSIELRVADGSVPQRRLGSGYYVRQVRIAQP